MRPLLGMWSQATFHPLSKGLITGRNFSVFSFLVQSLCIIIMVDDPMSRIKVPEASTLATSRLYWKQRPFLASSSRIFNARTMPCNPPGIMTRCLAKNVAVSAFLRQKHSVLVIQHFWCAGCKHRNRCSHTFRMASLLFKHLQKLLKQRR